MPGLVCNGPKKRQSHAGKDAPALPRRTQTRSRTFSSLVKGACGFGPLYRVTCAMGVKVLRAGEIRDGFEPGRNGAQRWVPNTWDFRGPWTLSLHHCLRGNIGDHHEVCNIGDSIQNPSCSLAGLSRDATSTQAILFPWTSSDRGKPHQSAPPHQQNQERGKGTTSLTKHGDPARPQHYSIKPKPARRPAQLRGSIMSVDTKTRMAGQTTRCGSPLGAASWASPEG